ncbi:MAG TPA: PKD domain-containing protein [Edaphocola sp.]|nr:PKD domain-containing protein [Edaphocola sp.]
MKRKMIFPFAFAGCFMIAGLFHCSSLFAQLAASTYQYESVSGSYTENSTSATSVSGVEVDDGTSSPLPIGFTFNYCGTNYTQLVAGSNGVLSFDPSISYVSTSNSENGLGDIQPALMPLWDDLSGAAGTATYETTGVAPNRVFTMEFRDWRWRYSSANPPTLSFEVKLYETTNIIEFVYRQEPAVNTDLKDATIGIADGNTPPGYLVLDGAGAAAAASSTNFTTSISDRPATGQIFRFKPVPALDMKADSIMVAGPFCTNAASMVSARVANLGTADVDTVQVFWSVDDVMQVPVTYTGSAIHNFFSQNNHAVVNLGQYFFADSTTRMIKAWTYLPNNTADMVSENDTVIMPVKPGIQGVITDIQPGDTAICTNSPLILDAGHQPAGCIFVWSNGAVTQQTSVDRGGVYTVMVQSPQGCMAYDTVTVTERPQPVAGYFGVVDHGNGDFGFTPAGMQNITRYFWDFGDGTTISDASGSSQAHHYSQLGTFAVSLTVSNPCGEVVLTKQVYVSPATGIAGAGNVSGDVLVYPNPANDQLVISSVRQELKSVALYNVLGVKVYQSVLKGGKMIMPVAGLPEGIYQLRVRTGRSVISRKVEIMR